MEELVYSAGMISQVFAFVETKKTADNSPGKNAGRDCGKDYERRDIKKKSGAAF